MAIDSIEFGDGCCTRKLLYFLCVLIVMCLTHDFLTSLDRQTDRQTDRQKQKDSWKGGRSDMHLELFIFDIFHTYLMASC